MRRITQWVTYPPNALISFAAVYLVISICYGVLVSPMDRLLRAVEIIQQETLAQGGEVQSPLRLDQWMLYGHPWIGLLVGVVAGSFFYSWQTRIRKRRFDEHLTEILVNILSGKPWKAISRRNLVVIIFSLPLILLSLSALFQLSVIMVSAGMQLAAIILYPVLRRQFDTIVATVADPSLEPKTTQRGFKWIRGHRRSAVFATGAAVVSIIAMLVFTVSNLDMWEGLAEDIRNIEELSIQYITDDKATPPGDPL